MNSGRRGHAERGLLVISVGNASRGIRRQMLRETRQPFAVAEIVPIENSHRQIVSIWRSGKRPEKVCVCDGSLPASATDCIVKHLESLRNHACVQPVTHSWSQAELDVVCLFDAEDEQAVAAFEQLTTLLKSRILLTGILGVRIQVAVFHSTSLAPATNLATFLKEWNSDSARFVERTFFLGPISLARTTLAFAQLARERGRDLALFLRHPAIRKFLRKPIFDWQERFGSFGSGGVCFDRAALVRYAQSVASSELGRLWRRPSQSARWHRKQARRIVGRLKSSSLEKQLERLGSWSARFFQSGRSNPADLLEVLNRALRLLAQREQIAAADCSPPPVVGRRQTWLQKVSGLFKGRRHVTRSSLSPVRQVVSDEIYGRLFRMHQAVAGLVERLAEMPTTPGGLAEAWVQGVVGVSSQRLPDPLHVAARAVDQVQVAEQLFKGNVGGLWSLLVHAATATWFAAISNESSALEAVEPMVLAAGMEPIDWGVALMQRLEADAVPWMFPASAPAQQRSFLLLPRIDVTRVAPWYRSPHCQCVPWSRHEYRAVCIATHLWPAALQDIRPAVSKEQISMNASRGDSGLLQILTTTTAK